MFRFRRFAACTATLVAALALLLADQRPAAAWWASGHAIVAMMAYRELKPETRATVDAILKGHPDYKNWLAELPAGTPEDKRGEYIIAIASTWPDRIKDSRDTTVSIKFFNPGDKRNPPPHPYPSVPETYPDLMVHDNWHYLDIPINADGKDHEIEDTDSILTALPSARSGLSKKFLPDGYRAYWLCWYIHLVGDVHQPLHATGRFSTAHSDGDQGGNAIHLQPDPAHPGIKNLHGFWDSLLGDGPDPKKYNSLANGWTDLNSTISTINSESPRLLAGYDSATRDSLDETRWLRESFTIAQEFIYTFGDPDSTVDVPQPDTTYRQTATRIAHQRAALAAHRLALALEASLKG